MKNRNIILIAILSLGCGGLPCTALPAILAPGLQPQNVIVANTATEPVPIRDAENPARNAVQQELWPLVSTGGGSPSVTIPAGKIFVLEFVSFDCYAAYYPAAYQTACADKECGQ